MKKFFKILMVFALLGGATLSCTKDYSQEIVDLKAQDANLKATIDALQNTLTALQNTKADKAALESLKTSLEGEINTLKTRVTATENDIKDLKKLVGDANKAISDLRTELTTKDGELEKSIDDLEKAVGELEKRIETLEGKVADLAARIQSIVAAAPTGEEVTAFTFGTQKITNLEMAFEITPSDLAKSLNTENCEIIVTEGMDVTRALTPDNMKAYTPATVEVNAKGEVVVNANINTKTETPNNAYWVALKVKGEDKAGVVEKMSQFVKAVESSEAVNVFDHAAWYDISGTKPVKQTNPMGAVAKQLRISAAPILWKANVPAKATDAVIPVDFKGILSDYALMFDFGGTPWTIEEIAAKLGIEDAELSIKDAQKSVMNELTYASYEEGDPEFEIFQFTENGGLDIDFAAEFATDDDLTNREYVGLMTAYNVPTIKIGEEKLEGFKVYFTCDIAGNTIHDIATEDELFYKWDYIHNTETYSSYHKFDNVKWTGKVDLEYASGYYWYVYDEDGHKLSTAAAGIVKTAIDLFSLYVEGIKFADEAKDYTASVIESDYNKSGAVYTDYSTDIPFTVAAKHEDVEAALTAESFVPNMTKGGQVEIEEDVCATIFSDLAAWTGFHTTATLADVKAAYVGTQKVLTSKESAKVTLVIPATGAAYVAYAPATLEYGKDYTFTFEDVTFGVGFEYTVTFSTEACPFGLYFTPIVEDENVLLAGQSEWFNAPNAGFYYTIDQAHFNKYIEVENIKNVPAGEIVTVKIGAPTYLDETGAKTTALGAGALHGDVLANLTAKDETYGAFNDGSVFDWGIDKSHKGFKGHSVKFEVTLLAGEVVVEKATLTLNTEKPVIAVEAKDCSVVRTPGEDEIINLYEYIGVTGIYDGFETPLWVNTYGNWHWIGWTKETPSYQAEIVLPTDVTKLAAKLNGEPFTLSAANARISGSILVLVKDNNPGKLEIDVPVKVSSVLDLNDPDKVGQAATIHVVAPLGE